MRVSIPRELLRIGQRNEGHRLSNECFELINLTTNSTSSMQFRRRSCFQAAKGVEPVFALKTNFLCREVDIKIQQEETRKVWNLGHLKVGLFPGIVNYVTLISMLRTRQFPQTIASGGSCHRDRANNAFEN